MYICSVCLQPSRPREPRHVLYDFGPSGAIRSERPACPTCHGMIEAGMPEVLVARQRRRPVQPAPEVVPEKAPEAPPKPPVAVRTAEAALPPPAASTAEPGVEVEVLGCRVELPAGLVPKRRPGGRTRKRGRGQKA